MSWSPWKISGTGLRLRLAWLNGVIARPTSGQKWFLLQHFSFPSTYVQVLIWTYEARRHYVVSARVESTKMCEQTLIRQAQKKFGAFQNLTARWREFPVRISLTLRFLKPAFCQVKNHPRSECGGRGGLVSRLTRLACGSSHIWMRKKIAKLQNCLFDTGRVYR